MNPKVPLPIPHHRCRFGSRPAVRTGPWTVERGQSPPPCLSGGRRSTAMFPGLHVTDLTPASGGAYTANREWCLSRGASVHPMPVSAFDYKHQLKGSGAPQEFDLILCFGLCMGVFGAQDTVAKHSSNSTVARQYRFLGSAYHQQIFNEALMGQSFSATHVLCHVASQARAVAPCALNYPSWRSRIYNPASGGRHLTQLMGRELAASREPLVANVTGPGAKLAATHTVTTRWNEDQLDVQSMVLTTLRSGGAVLILGAGRMSFFAHFGCRNACSRGSPDSQADVRCRSQGNKMF